MLRYFLCLLTSLLLGFSLNAQAPIQYTLDLGQIAHHELGVSVHFPALPPQPLVLRMPAASPGRYALHNFAKNVYEVQAIDAAGEALEVSRTGLHEWTVSGHGGSAQVSYTLYANRADGTYSKVDNRKLHLNMPSTFLYGRGLQGRPVELHIPLASQANWQVATQLERMGPERFRAPNYYYFYDSPTMVGDIRFRRWTVASGPRVDTIEMAFLCPDPDSLLDHYSAWTKDIVASQQKVYGELPTFDFGRYTFLCAYNPYVSGDGMEHRNSTVCSAPVGLEGYAERLIGTISHEFFHCWNVERLRPASLEPFDFDQPNLSGELWFAEGFTSYYDDLSLVRAGVITPEDYLMGLRGSLNYVLLRPGSALRSPVGMSQCAPFVDAATAIDSDNFDNTFISYYPYGAILAMALDLRLRRDFNTTLDAYMRLLWKAYGQTEVPYHIPDLQQGLAQLTGDTDFAKDWFARHVYGHELPPLRELLQDFGVATPLVKPDSVGFYQLRLDEQEDGLYVAGTVFRNNPLYTAGLEEGDHLVSLGEQPIVSRADWDEAVAKLQIGKTYTLRYKQNGVAAKGSFMAEVNPSFTVEVKEELPLSISARQQSWLRP